MKKIPFVKMHGLGNDFVIIDAQNLPNSADLNKFATAISDRKIGVGCDQFIIYERKQNEILMSIYNPDGKGAKACGNASRCLTRLMFDQYNDKDTTLNVDGRIVSCTYISQDELKVNMGLASFTAEWIPEFEKLLPLAERYRIEPKEMVCVDVGNPHIVIFSKLSVEDQTIIGEHFQKIDIFPQGINVNFATIEDDKIYLKVWERGTGFTLACGSGACATFAASCKLGFVNENAEVIFKMGSLKMTQGQTGIIMSGSATYVFGGEYYYG